MPWLRLRTIICENDAVAEIEPARARFRRFDEAWDGALWLLARNPRPQGSFATTYGGKEFILWGALSGGIDLPNLWLVYTFDENEVVIYGINAIEPTEEPEEGGD